jgi:hypothetical protein
MSSTLIVPPSTAVKPSVYKIPAWISELRRQQIVFERTLARPVAEYVTGFWRPYPTSACNFCSQELTGFRPYESKICGTCASRYGLGWPAVAALRPRCERCDSPFGPGPEGYQGKWTYHVNDKSLDGSSPKLCAVCWRRTRFPDVADYFEFHLAGQEKLMRQIAAEVFHFCSRSKAIINKTIEQHGSIRNSAIVDAANVAWRELLLCELVRLGDVPIKQAALAFLARAKGIVAEIETMNAYERMKARDVFITEDDEIDQLAAMDAFSDEIDWGETGQPHDDIPDELGD